MDGCKHWSEVEWLHKTVKNPNIIINGTHSYYSGCFDGPFEKFVVRYLYGVEESSHPETGWTPMWEIDKLIIGDYVQIAAGVKIIMGGNNNHNSRFISSYPFLEPTALQRSYKKAGDTIIGNDVWIGMCSMIMPGVRLGHGVIIAAQSVVTHDVPEYCLVGGNPAKFIRKRFTDDEIKLILELKWWEWSESKINALLPFIQNTQPHQLLAASQEYDQRQ